VRPLFNPQPALQRPANARPSAASPPHPMPPAPRPPAPRPAPPKAEARRYNLYWQLTGDPYCCGRGIVGGFQMYENKPFADPRNDYQNQYCWDATVGEIQAALEYHMRLNERTVVTATTQTHGQDEIGDLLEKVGWQKIASFENINTNNQITEWRYER
jgi:hypothetical protein